MAIKQSFELLNTLRFSLKHKVMLFIGQSYQVARSIIMLDPVKMMDNPPFRQRFPVNLLPNKDMLSDISVSICSAVFSAQSKNIATLLSIKASVPIMMPFTSFNQMYHLAIYPSAFLLTTLASLGMKSFNGSSTVYAYCRQCFARLHITFRAKPRPSVNHPITILARVSMPLFVCLVNFAMRLCHISSIALFREYIYLDGLPRQEIPQA